ncbi:hypothetical protein IWQ61_001410 [Dispira simplex]|nr:hypothetical protein IWQ61_001410 [Dispira simplex]
MQYEAPEGTIQPKFLTKASDFFARLTRRPSTPQLHTFIHTSPTPSLSTVTTPSTPVAVPTTAITNSTKEPHPEVPQLEVRTSSLVTKDMLPSGSPTSYYSPTSPDSFSTSLYIKDNHSHIRVATNPHSSFTTTTHSSTGPTVVLPHSQSQSMPFESGRPPLSLFASRGSVKSSESGSPNPTSTPDSSAVPHRRPKKMTSFWRFFNKTESSPTKPESPTSPSEGTGKHSRSKSVNIISTLPDSVLPAVKALPSLNVTVTSTPKTITPFSNKSVDGEDDDFQTVREYSSQQASLADSAATSNQPPSAELVGDKMAEQVDLGDHSQLPKRASQYSNSINLLDIPPSRPSHESDNVALVAYVKEGFTSTQKTQGTSPKTSAKGSPKSVVETSLPTAPLGSSYKEKALPPTPKNSSKPLSGLTGTSSSPAPSKDSKHTTCSLTPNTRCTTTKTGTPQLSRGSTNPRVNKVDVTTTLASSNISPTLLRKSQSSPTRPCGTKSSPSSLIADPPPTSNKDDIRAMEVARNLFYNEEPSLFPEEYVEYLGKRGRQYAQIRKHYFNHFDFKGKSLEEAFRSLCAHLFIRGESQVIDRILINFSRRFHECNPQHFLLTDEDIVYAIVFSILLLNTDLHVSQSDEKLSRSKFIKLTLTTVETCRHLATQKREATDTIVENTDKSTSGRQTSQPAPDGAGLTSPILSPMMKDLQSSRAESDSSASREGSSSQATTVSSGKRFSFFDTTGIGLSIGGNNGARNDERTSVLSATPSTAGRDMEQLTNEALTGMLKEIYNSIKHQKLAQPTEALVMSRASLSSYHAGNSMGAGPASGLTRSRSVSGLGPNNLPLTSGVSGLRSGRVFMGRRGVLGLGAGNGDGDTFRSVTAQSSPIAAVLSGSASNLPPDNADSGGRSSSSPRLLGIRRSTASPTRSRAASVSSFSPKRLTRPFATSLTLSDDEEYGLSDAPLQGFSASMLMTGTSEDTFGEFYHDAPVPNHHGYDERFVKSSVLIRKHLMERSDRRATNRSWKQCYVVLEHGMLNMYKMEKGQADGYELTDPSLQLGHVSLRHSLTSALPPPGYSRTRPHVFAIQLPHGGVYLFQASSMGQLREWVQCCNYWASRESKEPLLGGVCNIDYGWIDPEPDSLDEQSVTSNGPESTTGGEKATTGVPRNVAYLANVTASFQCHSTDSNTSLVVDSASDVKSITRTTDNLSSVNDPADRTDVSSVTHSICSMPSSIPHPTSIHQWMPPAYSLMRSNLDESAQLRALLNQITHLQSELDQHHELRGSIDLRFPPKSPIYNKAFSNWERKSQYLLRELIKYQTYADCLKNAIATQPPAAMSAGSSRPTSTRKSRRKSSCPFSLQLLATTDPVSQKLSSKNSKPVDKLGETQGEASGEHIPSKDTSVPDSPTDTETTAASTPKSTVVATQPLKTCE